MPEDKIEYTESAKADKIKQFLLENKEYIKILNAFGTKPVGTFQFNPTVSDLFTDWFLDDVEMFTRCIQRACKEIIDAWHGERRAKAFLRNVKIELIDSSHHIKLNEWDSNYEGIPVASECQVIGANKEETYTKHATAYCPECHQADEITNLSEIPLCTTKDCARYRMKKQIRQDTVVTGNFRIVMIQEPLEEAKHGSPRILECELRDDLVSSTFIGQRKKIVGIFHSHPQHHRATNRIVIQAISMQDLGDVEVMQPTDEQIKFFQELKDKENFIDVITESVAPEIKHEKLAKLCVLLSIIGGNKVGRLRGNIHCFLVGDPSTGKSSLLEYIPLIVQKTGFAVGGTMSGSGVTVTMDTLPNRQKMPRAGIVPLCSGSCVAIDELNQLDEEDIGKLYQAMEQGKINYNKGGFDLQLEANTTILAGANPRDYIYDYDRPIMHNINLPPPMVSRFDFKVNLLAQKSDIQEQEILDHIIKVRNNGIEKYIEENRLLTPKQLTLYINYVKTFKPIMTDEASKLLKEFQLTMQKTIGKTKGGFIIDKRFFESMYRIGTAYAKANMSETVTKEHAMTVIDIFKKTLATFNIVTEGKQEQETIRDNITSKDVAFINVLKNLESWFTMEEAVSIMIKKASHYFPTTTEAEKDFEKFHQKGMISKRGEKYRIG